MSADAPGGVRSPLQPLIRAKHAKRGTTYDMFGYAEMQADAPVAEGTKLVVYRGDDGKLWVRPREEFCDGRFTFSYPSTVVAHPTSATEGVGEVTEAQVEAAAEALMNEQHGQGSWAMALLFGAPVERGRYRRIARAALLAARRERQS